MADLAMRVTGLAALVPLAMRGVARKAWGCGCCVHSMALRA